MFQIRFQRSLDSGSSIERFSYIVEKIIFSPFLIITCAFHLSRPSFRRRRSPAHALPPPPAAPAQGARTGVRCRRHPARPHALCRRARRCSRVSSARVGAGHCGRAIAIAPVVVQCDAHERRVCGGRRGTRAAGTSRWWSHMRVLMILLAITCSGHMLIVIHVTRKICLDRVKVCASASLQKRKFRISHLITLFHVLSIIPSPPRHCDYQRLIWTDARALGAAEHSLPASAARQLQLERAAAALVAAGRGVDEAGTCRVLGGWVMVRDGRRRGI